MHISIIIHRRDNFVVTEFKEDPTFVTVTSKVKEGELKEFYHDIFEIERHIEVLEGLRNGVLQRKN